MHQEIKPLYSMLNTALPNFSIYCHQIEILSNSSLQVAFLKSGIGKVASGISTTMLIENFHPSVIINIGTAGSLVNDVSPGDVVITKSTQYCDVNVTDFSYKYGQVPGYPSSYHITKEINNFISKMTDSKYFKLFYGFIISSDSFVSGGSFLKNILYNFPGAIAADMEAASIAQTCFKFKTPLLSIKGISDQSDCESHLNFNYYANIASFNSCFFVTKLIKALNTK